MKGRHDDKHKSQKLRLTRQNLIIGYGSRRWGRNLNVRLLPKLGLRGSNNRLLRGNHRRLNGGLNNRSRGRRRIWFFNGGPKPLTIPPVTRDTGISVRTGPALMLPVLVPGTQRPIPETPGKRRGCLKVYNNVGEITPR